MGVLIMGVFYIRAVYMDNLNNQNVFFKLLPVAVVGSLYLLARIAILLIRWDKALYIDHVGLSKFKKADEYNVKWCDVVECPAINRDEAAGGSQLVRVTYRDGRTNKIIYLNPKHYGMTAENLNRELEEAYLSARANMPNVG
jgi:hypothetical protein